MHCLLRIFHLDLCSCSSLCRLIDLEDRYLSLCLFCRCELLDRFLSRCHLALDRRIAWVILRLIDGHNARKNGLDHAVTFLSLLFCCHFALAGCDINDVSSYRNVKLLCEDRSNLSGCKVCSLLAAEYDVKFLSCLLLDLCFCGLEFFCDDLRIRILICVICCQICIVSADCQTVL